MNTAMTSDDARRILKSAGVQVKRAAEASGVSRTYLSEYLNNKRILDQSEVAKLNVFLERVKTII